MGVISKEHRTSLDLLIDDIAVLEMMPGIHGFLDKQARHFYVRNTNNQDHTRYEEQVITRGKEEDKQETESRQFHHLQVRAQVLY